MRKELFNEKICQIYTTYWDVEARGCIDMGIGNNEMVSKVSSAYRKIDIVDIIKQIEREIDKRVGVDTNRKDISIMKN